MAGDRDRKIVEARKAEGWPHDGIVEIFLDEGMDKDQAEALVASVSAAPAPRRPLPPGRDGPRNRGPQTAKQLDWQAPFRFAPLNEKVLKPQAEVARLLRHDLADGEGLLSTPLKDGYSGQIKIDIAFDGPMLIGQAEGDVQKPLEIGARHCIPGATLRGLIRSTLEIAAFARLSQINADIKYRDKPSKGHEYSVRQVLARTKNGTHILTGTSADPDFVEALFGYMREPEKSGGDVYAQQHEDHHLKGRVAFSFAWLDETAAKILAAEHVTIMGAPKPSFGPFYLSSLGPKNWSAPDVTLAGRKLYPARNASVKQIAEFLANPTGEIGAGITPEKSKDNASVQSRLIFLEPKPDRPLRFQGEILVHNVTAEELGALLWALTFGGKDGLRHMIGRAKAAGAGQAQITASLDVAAHAPDAAAPKANDLMARFEALMGREVQGWATSPPVKALLACADPSKAAAMGRLRYMPLKKHKALNDAVGPNGHGGAAKATLLEP
jgi:hypothetical protein